MPRYFIELAYKGTAYNGFQVQDNADTIQGVLQKALAILFREEMALTGSSRTDAGVHARQNYFHFDTDLIISSHAVYNLNALLPADIAVKGIFPVPATAHCRFDAVSRSYRYLIYGRKDPFLVETGWQYGFPIDFSALQSAAAVVQAHTDFTSFAKRNSQVHTFNCTIQHSGWQQDGDQLVYTVTANRFLRGMVRGLVATMLKVGRGQMTVADFKGVLEARDNQLADFSAPPQGLYLERVLFEGELAKSILLTAK